MTVRILSVVTMIVKKDRGVRSSDRRQPRRRRTSGSFGDGSGDAAFGILGLIRSGVEGLRL